MDAQVRKALTSDTPGISRVIRAAFPGSEGQEIDELTSSLLVDATAVPLISLVAAIGGQVVGHALFTRVRLEGSPMEVSASILAPLSVHPEFQDRGIGGRLIREGFIEAIEAKTNLIFVLGHPAYYRKHGFEVAGSRGFEAPYPIADEHADAWMVAELRPGIIEKSSGRVLCADSLMDPRHWRE